MSELDTNQKAVRMEVRLTPAEHEEWRVAAARSRRTLSQWVRDCCNSKVTQRSRP